ncbi:AraC family transcriptional regulator [Breznakia sp. PF5-3]|uniref:AraC family transcriptional regulator n=1 Tax=unclassified Breznakia TaxID=2623764 RepID=UPI0024058283|nr:MULTISPECIES: AraC family transcriptional regulator [unclassified Breznakia]MDF9824741.1 AraC family transcriptional regulator [Breznakia sp. PM6-1]MDF9835692.1 AraC family transcriptional regulator [Breznakia sp. PF5-3]MDF9837741.1 AraC family transcriptional regulator [Breznakia sp. PFB2-8]MDF9859702.1 AraC family transcriptional regulator [Breznakia sp. PH5-24]
MNYLQALEIAINYIEDNMEKNITVFDIARTTGYSYYHFSRVFQAIIGESIGSYLKSRRLSEAADDLLNSNTNILEIALKYGFTTHEAFTRTFKKRYHKSPSSYRKHGVSYFIEKKKVIDFSMLEYLEKNHKIQKPKIMRVETFTTIGKNYQTSLLNNEIVNAWKDFISYIKKNITSIPIRSYALCNTDTPYYDEKGDVLFSHQLSIDYSSTYKNIPDTMEKRIVLGGRYAVFLHQGKVRDLVKTYEYIWGIWLLNNEEEFDESRVDFEVYDERFLGTEHLESIVEIFIPLK